MAKHPPPQCALRAGAVPSTCERCGFNRFSFDAELSVRCRSAPDQHEVMAARNDRVLVDLNMWRKFPHGEGKRS